MKIQEFEFDIDFWFLLSSITTCHLGNLYKWNFLDFNYSIHKIGIIKVFLHKFVWIEVTLAMS